MPKQYTPLYALPYPQVGDPIKEGAANMEELAKKTEEVLKNGSFPSSVPTTADITNRITVLEKPPLVVVELTGTDAVLGTTATESPIFWNTRACDTTMNPTGNTTRLVAPKTGWYEVNATLVFSNTSGGQRNVGFQTWKAGVKKFYRGMNNTSPSGSFFIEVTGHLICYLLANEYVVVTAEVNLAGASTSLKANEGTRASMKFLRPA